MEDTYSTTINKNASVSAAKLRVGDWVVEANNKLYKIVNISNHGSWLSIRMKSAIGYSGDTKSRAVALQSQIRIVRETRIVKI